MDAKGKGLRLLELTHMSRSYIHIICMLTHSHTQVGTHVRINTLSHRHASQHVRTHTHTPHIHAHLHAHTHARTHRQAHTYG